MMPVKQGSKPPKIEPRPLKPEAKAGKALPVMADARPRADRIDDDQGFSEAM